MAQSIFGAPYAVTVLNRAFNNASPSNAVFNNQVATAGTTQESQYAFAAAVGAAYANVDNATLATRVLTNLGVLPSTEPEVLALEEALADYFSTVAVQDRGIVVLQLGEILSGLEGATGPLAVYADAAAKWNTEVEKSFIYSSNPASTTSYNGDFPVDTPNQGQTFTLTTSPDNIVGTGGDDTVNAYLNTTAGSTTSTLSAADVISGGAGTDSLKVTVEGTGVGGSMPNANISGVENFFIHDLANTASTYNFGTINGEQQVWADTSTNNVTFSNLGTGATVGLKGNNVLNNLGNVSFSMANATDAVSIAIDGGVKDGSAGGGTLPTIIATAGTATAATISSTGAANTVGAIVLASGNSVKTLTVNAATNLTAVLTAADFAADSKLVVTGAGKVNLGNGFDGATIDASANTGGLTISTTATVTKAVTGSSAADSVTLVGTLAAGGKIELGAGDDKLLTGAGASIVATNVIDGGEGVDSISASLINAANAGAIKNFELLDVSATSNLDVELVTGSTIQGLTLSGGTGGGTVTNVAAGAGLSVSGSNTGITTIGVKGAAAATATADSFTTTFAGTAASTATAAAPTTVAAGTVVTNGVETLNVVSSGTGFVTNTLTVTDSTLQTLNITGDKALSLAFTAGTGTTPTGATDTVNGVKLVDGSAATGALTINTANLAVANAGLTVKTGTGNDSITLAQKATVDAGAGNDTIVAAAAGGKFTGGAGNDTFNVELAVATGTTEATAMLTTITDLSAGDKIDFAATATGAFNQTKVTLGAGVTNLELAFAAATGAANTTQWFQYGANTYIVSNDNEAAFDAGDTVIQLTGLIDLSAATMTGTVLTIA